MKQIASLGLSTPLSYGGGISSLADAFKIISLGVERIVIDSMLMTSPEKVLHITEALGVQDISIASLPLSCFNDTLLHFSYIDKTSSALVDRPFFKFISKFFSEYLLIDWQNEGGSESLTPLSQN